MVSVVPVTTFAISLRRARAAVPIVLVAILVTATLVTAPTGAVSAAAGCDPATAGQDVNWSRGLIGAPEAWHAGYTGKGVKVAVLDTGYDQQHSDLGGRVVAAKDFTGSRDGTRDTDGHGTHVASTVAGSGAGSNGCYRGVAPEADLLIGKVLDGTNPDFTVTVIAGMEWAVASGARVVNLSLGTHHPTDGNDPLSQAVTRLSAATGALFVVSSGNMSSYVEGPGSAALSVGSVDRNRVVAPISTGGPRVGDNALKPEVTAPGEKVVAARAHGVREPIPDNPLYTMDSGTSMAAPHVAGAAAILAQAHPEWRAPQLKAALIGSATPAPDTHVYRPGRLAGGGRPAHLRPGTVGGARHPLPVRPVERG
ncbi:S8 family serine peptidase [Saccharopolyspora sp. 5N102]|uniref:S8 family serine peptidase n=1 Tax=Saccharopolyspora sp. 5N102 TaxID=3375155 RepID=UPI0037950FF3